MPRIIIQVCLSDPLDKEFLEAYAKERNLSLSSAVLDMCNFYDKKNVYLKGIKKTGSVIKDLMFSDTPLDDYKEY